MNDRRSTPTRRAVRAVLVGAGRPLTAREISRGIGVEGRVISESIDGLLALDWIRSTSDRRPATYVWTGPELTYDPRELDPAVRKARAVDGRRVLALLAASEPMTRREIAEALGVSYTSLCAVVAPLIGRGVIHVGGRAPRGERLAAATMPQAPSEHPAQPDPRSSLVEARERIVSALRASSPEPLTRAGIAARTGLTYDEVVRAVKLLIASGEVACRPSRPGRLSSKRGGADLLSIPA